MDGISLVSLIALIGSGVWSAHYRNQGKSCFMTWLKKAGKWVALPVIALTALLLLANVLGLKGVASHLSFWATSLLQIGGISGLGLFVGMVWSAVSQSGSFVSGDSEYDADEEDSNDRLVREYDSGTMHDINTW